MRHTGTKAYGIRLPIINRGDKLDDIVVSSLMDASGSESIAFENGDVVGITEAIVAKAQNNYASITDIGEDVKRIFGGGTVGVVFPILSRNRFVNILKGIALGAEKVCVLVSCPSDEVGNPIIDADTYDEVFEGAFSAPIPAAEFKRLSNNFVHPFTKLNYLDLYANVSDNVEVYVSNDPRHILQLTDNVIVGEIHTRFRTKKRLERAGAKKICTLSDILSTPSEKKGYNSDYGVLGSNIATGEVLKLFPRDCGAFVESVQKKLAAATGKNIEVLVYGDGAFKDPFCGIWELADPVVSPAYTPTLGGQPSEIKLKYIAENCFAGLAPEEKNRAVTDMIRNEADKKAYSEGTTPRKYADLLGSLCDLMSGSGDKGTPVILIKGYFDNYAAE